VLGPPTELTVRKFQARVEEWGQGAPPAITRDYTEHAAVTHIRELDRRIEQLSTEHSELSRTRRRSKSRTKALSNLARQIEQRQRERDKAYESLLKTALTRARGSESLPEPLSRWFHEKPQEAASMLAQGRMKHEVEQALYTEVRRALEELGLRGELLEQEARYIAAEAFPGDIDLVNRPLCIPSVEGAVAERLSNTSRAGTIVGATWRGHLLDLAEDRKLPLDIKPKALVDEIYEHITSQLEPDMDLEAYVNKVMPREKIADLLNRVTGKLEHTARDESPDLKPLQAQLKRVAARYSIRHLMFGEPMPDIDGYWQAIQQWAAEHEQRRELLETRGRALSAYEPPPRIPRSPHTLLEAYRADLELGGREFMSDGRCFVEVTDKAAKERMIASHGGPSVTPEATAPVNERIGEMAKAATAILGEPVALYTGELDAAVFSVKHGQLALQRRYYEFAHGQGWELRYDPDNLQGLVTAVDRSGDIRAGFMPMSTPEGGFVLPGETPEIPPKPEFPELADYLPVEEPKPKPPAGEEYQMARAGAPGKRKAAPPPTRSKRERIQRRAIVNRLEEVFEAPLRVGRIRGGRKILGVYRGHYHTIRARGGPRPRPLLRAGRA